MANDSFKEFPRTISGLLACRQEVRSAMGNTHFEQISLETVKQMIATNASLSTQAQCTICGDQVQFEDSKTDERGRAVHENCYVRKLRHS